MKVQLDLDLLLDRLTVEHSRLVSSVPNRIQRRVSKDGQTTCKFRFGHRSILCNRGLD